MPKSFNVLLEKFLRSLLATIFPFDFNKKNSLGSDDDQVRSTC